MVRQKSIKDRIYTFTLENAEKKNNNFSLNFSTPKFYKKKGINT